MRISSIAKYIDQPYILLNLQKKMPAFLIGSAAGYGLYDTFKQPEGKRTKQAVKNTVILSSIITSLLYGGRKIKIGGKQLVESPKVIETVLKQKRAISEYLTKNAAADGNSRSILKKAEKKSISPEEIDYLLKNLPDNESRKKLFKTIFSEPDSLTSKEIFEEIGRLSVLGLVPVVSGVAGGIVADKITKTSTKKGTANKIKEGAYQFLANIFLCNVGAGAALFGMEALNKRGVVKNLTPAKKLVAILSGITVTGILGGSMIANYLCKKLVNPLFDSKTQGCMHHNHHQNIYSERKPESLDIAMHTDDIATAGVLSGFKWIEPALPLMYMMSGYRAGIGYRNNSQKHVDNNQKQKLLKVQQVLSEEKIYPNIFIDKFGKSNKSTIDQHMY